MQLRIKVSTTASPQFLRRNGFSDHSPILLHISTRPAVPPGPRPIPPSIAAHFLFSSTVNKLFHYYRIENMQVIDRCCIHKAIIKNAAKATRDFLLATSPASTLTRSLFWGSLARAHWRGDHKFAQTALRNLPGGREIVEVVSQRIVIPDFRSFAICTTMPRLVSSRPGLNPLTQLQTKPNLPSFDLDVRFSRNGSLNLQVVPRRFFWEVFKYLLPIDPIKCSELTLTSPMHSPSTGGQSFSTNRLTLSSQTHFFSQTLRSGLLLF